MSEVLVIALVVLLFFGGKKIPELMKGLGKGVRSFKDGMKEIEKDIEERDYRDMHREISPLKAAPDAVILDTSDMDIPQVIERIMELAEKAGIAGKEL